MCVLVAIVVYLYGVVLLITVYFYIIHIWYTTINSSRSVGVVPYTRMYVLLVELVYLVILLEYITYVS